MKWQVAGGKRQGLGGWGAAWWALGRGRPDRTQDLSGQWSVVGCPAGSFENGSPCSAHSGRVAASPRRLLTHGDPSVHRDWCALSV
jgi:hypothetical protein